MEVQALRLCSKITIYLKTFLAYNAAMKKYVFVLVTAGVLAACEKKTETVTPGTSPSTTASSETTTGSATGESPAAESTSPPSP
jgi:uncharacterized lipoprotein YajG